MSCKIQFSESDVAESDVFAEVGEIQNIVTYGGGNNNYAVIK